VRVPAVEARGGRSDRTRAGAPPCLLVVSTIRAAREYLVGAPAVPGSCRGAAAVGAWWGEWLAQEHAALAIAIGLALCGRPFPAEALGLASKAAAYASPSST